jgi:hypothetical protein
MRMSSNQISYLKGSSIKSFTLEPNPKIDFNSAQQRLKRGRLSTMTLKYNSLSITEFNTEFLQFTSLMTSVYRLQVQMSVWLWIPRRRLDDRHKASGRTTVRSTFQNLQKFFHDLSRVRTVLPCRPNGHTSTARNFHVKASRIQTGIHIVRTVETIFPCLCFEKKSHNWSNTEWRPDVLLKRLNGCNLEQFETSRHWWASGRKVIVIRTDDTLTDERPDGIPRHPDGCNETELIDLNSAQSFLEAHNWSVDSE